MIESSNSLNRCEQRNRRTKKETKTEMCLQRFQTSLVNKTIRMTHTHAQITRLPLCVYLQHFCFVYFCSIFR